MITNHEMIEDMPYTEIGTFLLCTETLFSPNALDVMHDLLKVNDIEEECE